MHSAVQPGLKPSQKPTFWATVGAVCHRSLATARVGYSEVTCQKNDSRGHFKGKVTLPAGVNKGGVNNGRY